MNKQIVASLVAASFFPVSTWAEPNTETVVVTASRFAQSDASVLQSATILTRQDIARLQARSLVDVLRTVPSIEIAQSGGRGQLASIFMRGTESDHSLVLIDGVRMASSITGSVDFNQIPVNSIERIEIIRGARATLYGSSAIGGVINIITKTDKERANVSVTMGSLDHHAVSGAWATKLGDNGHFSGMAGYESSDGYNVHPTPSNRGDQHGFTGRNAQLGYSHRWNASWSADITGRWYQNEYDYDYSGSLKHGWLESQALAGNLNYRSGVWSATLSGEFSQRDKYDYFPGSARKENKNSDLEQVSTSLGLQYQASEGWLLGGGVDYRHDTFNEGSLITNPDDIAINPRDNLGTYFLTQFSPVEPLSIEASVRLDDNEQYGQHTTWQTSAGLAIAEGYQLVASYSTAFKAPLFTELYGQYGDENLNPDESANTELALHGLTADIDWSLTGYINHIDNMIDYDLATSKYRNVEEVTIKGVEFITNFDVRSLNNRISLEYKDPKNDKTGEQLARRAKRVAKWDASYQWEQVQLGTQWQYQSERLDYSGGDMLGSYSLWTVTASYRATENLTVKGKVDNVFDKEYETAGGYPAAERAYFMTLDYQY
ncbi:MULTISPECIES: TonB-dependent receptor domain-containing protein [unclassified Salinivibrio]|uniref:TonB-dependent receptor domain-containing protein n=1 Tax=unclassified Salinivibrio TaxID=2636825 RepID=UPI00128E8E81|nr:MULTISPECIES: TonB-dependent receptor [unclassified Salinivibrio]MPS33236.1 TonB-dependent receptor [Salinivibrio sp. VYel7]MPX91740.1 TonB-dependent receptor [Salinivibrio sp. VYel1]MPX94621.1 TonB-dependent receptor [Salinivibrio sp. VYel9]MPX97767.1 TonB-dependent receptor [Salinivibrio sp. VYel6]MPY00983.1 TonB-dependent receptor [Salinivibrio sp. VYel4]